MRKNYIYLILAFVGMLFSCQRIELPQESQQDKLGEGVFGEATISFSAMLPKSPQTKAMGDGPTTDIKSMHLVIFDNNGMLVETRKAEIGSATVHGEHNYETKFTVTLSITDQPRIIHFIANCPVDQIAYGHEASIIGNLYVTKGEAIETAYWARAEVPDLIVETDATTGLSSFMGTATQAAFTCVPMLRNYAQIVVRNKANDFVFEGFQVYNTIDKGTVAPYNNKIQGFQNFLDSSGQKYSYPELISLKDSGNNDISYEGHALSSASLNSNLSASVALEANPGADGYPISKPYYMYERRIYPMTDQEELWHESPTHLVIKGNYKNEGSSYYKVDLVYTTTSSEGVEKVNYYHILRNFKYQFTINSVEKSGYPTPEAAIIGAPNNILSGSTTTTKFTNISDRQGRLWVNYTDATLVEGGEVTLMYKYIPEIRENEPGTGVVNNKIAPDQKYGEAGGLIILEDMLGSVITDYKVADKDINDPDSPWDGFREVTLTVKDPTAVTQKQAIVVRTTDNPDLNREVRYYLKRKLNFKVECTEVVPAAIGEKLQVNILIPDDPEITADMFPMDLAIEAWNTGISPDVSEQQAQLPVYSGPSTIPAKNGKSSFYFVRTIDTYDEYKNGIADGYYTVETHWLTNMVDNASYVVATNKYFNYAYDSWVNSAGQQIDNPFALFKNLKFTTIPSAADQKVTFSFAYDESVTTEREDVTITFTGVKADPTDTRLTLVSADAATGTYVYTFTPVAESNGIIALMQKIEVTTISARGDVSVKLEATSYMATSLTDKSRPYYTFAGKFSEEGPLDPAAGTPVNYSFYVDYPVDAITITMEGLAPVSGDAVTIETLATRAAGEPELVAGSKTGEYIYRPNGNTGKVNLALQTTTTVSSGKKTLAVAISDGGVYYKDERTTIEQGVSTVTYSGTISDETDYSFTTQIQNTNVTASYTISVNGIEYKGGSLSITYLQKKQGKTTYYTGINNFTIKDVNISAAGLTDTTKVNITITVTRGGTTNKVNIETTLGKCGLTKQ